MARIRTIKPKFFRHFELYEAERETALPLRVAFAGLWTAADRDGRFEWRPDELKLDCLPFDPVDFPRVLDALGTRGFIARYTVDGRDYGCIPSWTRHQVINNRESPSELPEPPNPLPAFTSTRGPRVADACGTPLVHARGEGEQEGKGTGRGTDDGSRVRASSSPFLRSTDFERLRRTHAYVGARLRVPNVLHDECVTKLGGDDPGGALLAWYAELDEALELSKDPIPDVFDYLRPRFTAWARTRHTDDALAKWVAEG